MVDEAKKTHVELQVSASRHKTSWSDECHRPWIHVLFHGQTPNAIQLAPKYGNRSTARLDTDW